MSRYKCTLCSASFDDMNAYVNHLEDHEQLINEMPKPEKKESVLSKIMFWKQENDKKEIKEEIPMVENVSDEKLNQLADAVGRLTSKVDELASKEEQPESFPFPRKIARISEPVRDLQLAGEKTIRVSVLVNEKKSGELISLIQENKNYVMDGVEVVKEED